MQVESTPDHSKRRRRRFACLCSALFLVIVLIALLLWLLFFQFQAYTDDAYVEGNLVTITPLRGGFITSIHTDDTFLVKKGQLLVSLDRTDDLLELDRKKSELANRVREVCQAFHQVFVALSDMEVQRAELTKALQDYQNREEIVNDQGISYEDFEHATQDLEARFFAYNSSERLFEKALAFVQGTSIKNHPLVLESRDSLIKQLVELYRCNIFSPVEGLTAQRTSQVGMWIPSGQPLMSVIPLDQIWVNANFKETQMRKMRLGQRVRLTSDLYGRGVVYHGTIVGLPGGAGNVFSLLPPQNLSGNWIKIVQRLPVRVHLDGEELKKHPLRVGLSMEVTVDLTDQEGGLIPENSEGAPTYATSIFEYEEAGGEALAEKIIFENLDPNLLSFATQELFVARVNLDPAIREAIQKVLCRKK